MYAFELILIKGFAIFLLKNQNSLKIIKESVEYIE